MVPVDTKHVFTLEEEKKSFKCMSHCIVIAMLIKNLFFSLSFLISHVVIYSIAGVMLFMLLELNSLIPITWEELHGVIFAFCAVLDYPFC